MWTLTFRKDKTAWLDKDGILVSKTVYSGAPGAVNDPSQEAIPDVGPIPRGLWRISGPPQDTEKHGPYVLGLYPEGMTQAFGRTGFLCHGDSIAEPGTASKGCVIADRVTRTRIWQSGDVFLTVTSE